MSATVSQSAVDLQRQYEGIVVHDPNGDGKTNNISETLSEYYNGVDGVAGSNGVAGTKLFANGFAALKRLNTGNGASGSAGWNDNIFDSKDAAWAELRVWVDTNHDGKSWNDANGNNLLDAGEQTEIKTFEQLGNQNNWLTGDGGSNALNWRCTT